MKFVRISGTNFIRDTESMGIINTDINAKNEYLAKANMMKAQKEEINKVKSEIADIKEDISEIKQLIINLIGNKLNG